MEIERKLALPDGETADRMAQDPQIRAYERPHCREDVPMWSVYYDTEDYRLADNRITFRMRQEGSTVVATVKWGGTAEQGLFCHQEVNRSAPEAKDPTVPLPELFDDSDAGPLLRPLLAGQQLHTVLEMRFLRRRTQIEYGGSVMEVAVDTGFIQAGEDRQPICEAEIELFSGDPEQVMRFSESLQERYRLSPENRSKYARGLALIENNRRK